MQSERENTLMSIPARARAVYAPRENPKIHILSPYWSIQMSHGQVVSGERALSRTVLHEKLVSGCGSASVHFERTKSILVRAPWV